MFARMMADGRLLFLALYVHTYVYTYVRVSRCMGVFKVDQSADSSTFMMYLDVSQS